MDPKEQVIDGQGDFHLLKISIRDGLAQVSGTGDSPVLFAPRQKYAY
jgi:hypothetical protein